MTLTSEINPNQSLELLKELHILTRDGKLNQDSRRKLKQVYHLYNFIEPLLNDVMLQNPDPTLVDHGAGKSYLGFILYDLFTKQQAAGQVIGIETRAELVEKSRQLAADLNFKRMDFQHLSVEEATTSNTLPSKVDIVTALHACNTATDDAILGEIAGAARAWQGPGRQVRTTSVTRARDRLRNEPPAGRTARAGQRRDTLRRSVRGRGRRSGVRSGLDPHVHRAAP